MIDLSKFTPAQIEALMKWWATQNPKPQQPQQPQQPAQGN